ncbi:MAG TPA: type II secretion system secretin GspD [Myxococcota bacterium]|nr:type II secretion system secretin GspD [Myxococcota bacterium]
MSKRVAIAGLLVASLALGAVRAVAQIPPPQPGSPAPGEGAPPPDADQEGLVQLDFNDVELAVVIDTISRLTGKNFIYDDRVRGRVTIVSPTRIPVEQAYAVFESVLQVKGFTTVPGPGGSIKIIPLRDAKESAIETRSGPRPTPYSDAFVTRLIPLRYIDADAISNSLKPLVSKDAALVAYSPTNTIILTDSASNIRRILEILEAIDVETYKEELAVLKIRHADATALAQQLGEIYGGEVSGAQGGGPGALRVRPPQVPGGQPQIQTGEVQRDRVRIITDERTNSLIILASRSRIQDIRALVAKLDVPMEGSGRIHVYYLKNADAEELADTLNALISGQPRAPSGGGGQAGGARPAVAAVAQQAQAQSLRAAVTELAEGVTVTADKGTNSLIIQASKEGFTTLAQVIEKLDIRRPQVMVEALIMEVTVSNSEDLGFNGLFRVVNGGTDLTFASLTDAGARPIVFGAGSAAAAGTGGTTTTTTPASRPGQLNDSALTNLLASAAYNTLQFNPVTGAVTGGSLIQGVIRAAQGNSGANILSAPHILTTDNEEAQIKIGNNIPLPSSRVQSAQGIVSNTSGQLATSVNIERQDIGITLRVTPQISEGDTLRLEIFQEISDLNQALTNAVAGGAQNAAQTGVALSNRQVENTVVVKDGETVVIGGLISDNFQDTIDKVPWLGDVPFLGWLFKSTSKSLAKTNLIVFLTPTIVRTAEDMERTSIRKREEFRLRSAEAMDLSERGKKAEAEHRKEAEAAGIDYEPSRTQQPAATALKSIEKRYPLERMRELERIQQEQRAAREAEGAEHGGPSYYVLAAVFRNEAAARAKLQELLDAGFDATIVSVEQAGEVLLEVRVGPFDTLHHAEIAADTLRQAHGLSPTVLVQEEETR